VKVINFVEQNGNRAANREFFIDEAHIHYWRKQKEALYKAKCNGVPKPENFLNLKRNYLNTSWKKRGRTATPYLAKYYSYECVK
jgi:hypothetical protein